MKRVLIISAFIPIISIAQQKGKKVNTYGEAVVQLTNKSKFGLGGLLGYKINNNFGIGAGFELGSYNKETDVYFYPVYFDARYIVKNNKSIVTPFIGLQYGTLLGNTLIKTSNSTSYQEPLSSNINRTTTTISNNIQGKSFWGFEIGIYASKKRKYFGPMISLAYRNCSFLNSINTNVKQTSGLTTIANYNINQDVKSGGNIYVLKMGFKF